MIITKCVKHKNVKYIPPQTRKEIENMMALDNINFAQIGNFIINGMEDDGGAPLITRKGIERK